MQLVRWVITFCMLSLLTMSTADAAKCDSTLIATPIVVDLDNPNVNPDVDTCAVSAPRSLVAISDFAIEHPKLTYCFSNALYESIRAPPVAD